MLTICNPLFLLNITSQILTATLEEKSYDSYLQKLKT